MPTIGWHMGFAEGNLLSSRQTPLSASYLSACDPGQIQWQLGAEVLQIPTSLIKTKPLSIWGDFRWERWILLLISVMAGVTFQPGYVGL